MFVPLGLNYDRVLEDRTLLLASRPEARRPGSFARVWQHAAASSCNNLRAAC